MLYEELADALRRALDEAAFPVGARLPGVRRLAMLHGVSISTVMRALERLEAEGRIEGRARAGFFVLGAPQRVRTAGAAGTGAAALDAPRMVTTQSVTLDLLQASRAARFGQLGVAMPDPGFLPLKALQRSFRQTRRWQSGETAAYAFPPGILPLREQIAKRLARAGCTAGPDRVQITSGAQEALSLCLRVLAQPGDVIAVESPTYYGLLQCLHTLGLKAIEVPTDRDRGISIPALRMALEQWPVRACVLVPNHGNPVGHAMSEADKRELAALLDESGTPLVEDDVYGDFGHDNPRPRTLQSLLRRSEWFLVGSASKSVSAGLRLGWLVAPAARRRELDYLQYTQTTGASTLDQYALADYLARGGHDRHLRKVRLAYAELTRRMRAKLLAEFPQGTLINVPAGGYLLWVTGPPALDAMALHARAIAEGIAIFPGPLFSASGRFASSFRLNAAVAWTDALDGALSRLAELAHEQLELSRSALATTST
ncbi:MAG: PLP-dependent aminotransferase family protein [Pseudomonadales bacterium]|nr:PLP-dependent aminotransferase family protein [Pseudomonadales bacterium]